MLTGRCARRCESSWVFTKQDAKPCDHRRKATAGTSCVFMNDERLAPVLASLDCTLSCFVQIKQVLSGRWLVSNGRRNPPQDEANGFTPLQSSLYSIMASYKVCTCVDESLEDLGLFGLVKTC